MSSPLPWDAALQTSKMLGLQIPQYDRVDVRIALDSLCCSKPNPDARKRCWVSPPTRGGEQEPAGDAPPPPARGAGGGQDAAGDVEMCLALEGQQVVEVACSESLPFVLMRNTKPLGQSTLPPPGTPSAEAQSASKIAAILSGSVQHGDLKYSLLNEDLSFWEAYSVCASLGTEGQLAPVDEPEALRVVWALCLQSALSPGAKVPPGTEPPVTCLVYSCHMPDWILCLQSALRPRATCHMPDVQLSHA
eukprot:gene16822-23101_t